MHIRQYLASRADCAAINLSDISVQMEAIMNWEQVEGNWTQLKGHIKTNWGKLTDDDLDKIDGQRDVLVGRIQEQYGIAKEQAEKEVDKFVSSQ